MNNFKELSLIFLETAKHQSIFVYVLIAIILLIVFRIVVMIFKLSYNKFLGLTVKPYSQKGRNNERWILLLGDSTAVGTGASHWRDTIAGRFARDYPDIEIVNVAQNGGLVRNLHGQIKNLNETKFDLVIVSVGGNDVWHLTSLRSIRKELRTVLPILKLLSNQRVLFLIYNNIGFAPLFPKVLRTFLKCRCDLVQRTIREISEECDIPTIDLFTEKTENPFLNNPENLFAMDGIHPNSEGYKLWYNRLWLIMNQNGYHF